MHEYMEMSVLSGNLYKVIETVVAFDRLQLRKQMWCKKGIRSLVVERSRKVSCLL